MDISLIICTCNNCESLRDTLLSLQRQEDTAGYSYEIIVVDNNSTDKTREVVKECFPEGSPVLRYIFEPEKGKSNALNRGIKEAKGDYIATTDDDVIVDKKWIATLIEDIRKYGFDGMSGRVLPLYEPDTPKWVKDNGDLLCGPIVSHDYGGDIVSYDERKMNPFVGANMAIKRNVFDELGYFRTDLGPGTQKMGDDTEFFERMKNSKKKLYYCGNAVVWHKAQTKRMNMRYFSKYFISLGRYYMDQEFEEAKKKNVRCLFDVPLYIVRYQVIETAALLLNVFDRRKRLKTMIRLWVYIGRSRRFSELNLLKRGK